MPWCPADGNGAEVGGVSQDVMDLFSSRAVAVTGELKRLAQEYADKHGKPPTRRTLWLLHQQAGQNTRRTKSQARRTIAGHTGTAEPTGAQRLAGWEAQTVHREVRALSAVHEQVAQCAKERAAAPSAVLDDAAKRTAARIAVAEVQRHHAVWSMAQLRFEVHRALPVLEPGSDGEAVVTEVARLAVCGDLASPPVRKSAGLALPPQASTSIAAAMTANVDATSSGVTPMSVSSCAIASVRQDRCDCAMRLCDPLPNHALPDQGGAAARRRWPGSRAGLCLGGPPGVSRATAAR